MTVTKPLTSLRDVLYAFSLAKRVPDAELLDIFVRRYPEHAAEITDFAIALAIDAARRDDTDIQAVEPSVSPTVSRVMSRFQNSLFVARSEKEGGSTPLPIQSSATENPFIALDRAAFRGLAARLNASTVFVAKLRDRQIEPSTMTAGFRQCVACELGVPIDVVAAHFAAQAEGNVQQFYKADCKPTAVERQTFAEAVRTSGLTEEQQRYLMSL